MANAAQYTSTAIPFIHDDRALVGESIVLFGIMGITATNADRTGDSLCGTQSVVISMTRNVFGRLHGDEMECVIHMMSPSNVH